MTDARARAAVGVRTVAAVAVARALRDEGWPVRGGSRRWRLGELTVAWDAVAWDAVAPGAAASAR